MTVTLTGEPGAAEIAVRDGRLVEAARPRSSTCGRSQNLRGRHNWQNVAVAYAAVRALGLTPAQAVAGLPSFRGLPHRMEEVARAGRRALGQRQQGHQPRTRPRSRW